MIKMNCKNINIGVLSVLEALPLSDIEDTLEGAHNILDDLWRHEPPYPKMRIEHLMDIIGKIDIFCIYL